MQRKYNSALWATARDFGFDKDMIHEIIAADLGHTSVKELTDEETMYIIDKIKGKQCRIPTVKGMASYAQKQYIKALADGLGWTDPKRLAGFIHKYAKTDHIDWLTMRQASAIIEGLKKTAVRQGEKANENG